MTKISTLQAQCSQVDSDGSGSIEFLEFLLLMGRILKDVPTDADLRDVFTGKLQLAKTRGSKPCSGHEGDHQGAGTDLLVTHHNKTTGSQDATAENQTLYI